MRILALDVGKSKSVAYEVDTRTGECGFTKVVTRLAELLVALIDQAHRFRRANQIGSYLGLVPRQFQSGVMDRHGRITRRGNRLARSLLVEASWVALRYNPHLRAIYERVHRGSRTRRKVAIVAVARHLAVIAWAMLRDGTTWQPVRAETPAACH